MVIQCTRVRDSGAAWLGAVGAAGLCSIATARLGCITTTSATACFRILAGTARLITVHAAFLHRAKAGVGLGRRCFTADERQRQGQAQQAKQQFHGEYSSILKIQNIDESDK